MSKTKIIGTVIAMNILLVMSNVTALAQVIQPTIPVINIVPGASNPVTKMPYNPSTVNLLYSSFGIIIKWVNTDTGVFHTVTSFNNIFDSGVIAPGSFYNHTFFDRGYYNYYCRFHPFMNGVVIIS